MKKIIIAIILICLLLIAFTICSFAYDSSNEYLYISVDNKMQQYYLFKYYSNSSASFRIYIQNYFDNTGIYITDLGYLKEDGTYDIVNNNLNLYVDVNKFLYNYMLLNSICLSFTDFMFDPENSEYESALFKGMFIRDCFFMGYYAMDSIPINNTNTFENFVSNYDILDSYSYVNNGVNYYFQSINNAMYFNSYYTDYYTNSDNYIINNRLYIAQTEIFRDYLCKSIFNLLFYELQYKNITYNDIVNSDYGYMLYGNNSSYTGQFLNLCELEFDNYRYYIPNVYVVTNTKKPTLSLTWYFNSLKDSSTYLTESFSWCQHLISPVFAVISILITGGIIYAVKKVVIT